MSGLDLLILTILHLKPMSGYEIQRMLMEMFGRRVSFGVIYPRLHTLQAARLLEVVETRFWGNPELSREPEAKVRVMKRVFSLTELGRERAQRGIAEMSSTVRRMETIALQQTKNAAEAA